MALRALCAGTWNLGDFGSATIFGNEPEEKTLAMWSTGMSASPQNRQNATGQLIAADHAAPQKGSDLEPLWSLQTRQIF